MSRKSFIILAIIVQLIILSSFVVRYELLKSTGNTVYIPLRGYDPTDIFRGDYVNLSYELPYSKSKMIESNNRQQYIIPTISGSMITGIQEITTEKPESEIYFQIMDGWMQDSERQYTIKTGSGRELNYTGSSCMDMGIAGTKILYLPGSADTVSDIQSIQLGTESGTDDYGYEIGTLISQSSCSTNYRFQTTATDRWFVPEGTGLDLEKKIRDNQMYGEWKLGKNGAVIITDILSEDELPR